MKKSVWLLSGVFLASAIIIVSQMICDVLGWSRINPAVIIALFSAFFLFMIIFKKKSGDAVRLAPNLWRAILNGFKELDCADEVVGPQNLLKLICFKKDSDTTILHVVALEDSEKILFTAFKGLEKDCITTSYGLEMADWNDKW